MLVVALVAAGMVLPQTADAGAVSLNGGNCLGSGTSYAGAGAQSTTMFEPGYGSHCVDYYHTCSYVLGGHVYGCGTTGWYPSGVAVFLSSGTTFVATTHNICDLWTCNGYVGTNSL